MDTTRTRKKASNANAVGLWAMALAAAALAAPLLVPGGPAHVAESAHDGMEAPFLAPTGGNGSPSPPASESGSEGPVHTRSCVNTYPYWPFVVINWDECK